MTSWRESEDPKASSAMLRQKPAEGDTRSRPDTAVCVCFPFIGDVVGGSHISALNLILHLDPERFRPLVVLAVPDGPLARIVHDRGVVVEPAPTTRYLERGRGSLHAAATLILRETMRLRRYLRERDVRIVHTNEGRIHATWAIPARLAGAKHLWHHRADREVRGVRFLAPIAADRVVAVSRFALPRAGRLSAADQSTVVHSPFDTEGEQPDPGTSRARLLAELGCPPDTRVVGFVGNLVDRKRPQTFIRAIADLRSRIPDKPLVAPVFGDDLDRRKQALLDLIAQLGVGEIVRLMGFRHPGEEWIAACNVLLVPAVGEPFGRTLIEAMLAGTPVVAADSGGNPEILRHRETGFLVPPDRPEVFSRQAAELLEDRGLAARVRDAARLDAVARFGLRQHADAIMRVYDEMLEGTGCPH
jgi:glycosyltransferase involved in cell wall biosynthesis